MLEDYFDNYCYKYPNIVIEILEYFDISNSSDRNISRKSVLHFCEQHKTAEGYIYQPIIVNRICKRLCEKGILESISNQGALGFSDNYLFVIKDRTIFQKNREQFKNHFNCIVYGFDYIYELYRELVVPIVWDKGGGEYSAGTGFKFLGGIATAKHCLKDAANIQIKGYKASDLVGKPIYVSDNKLIDLAYIYTGIIEEPTLLYSEGKVMEDVLVMGYPKIPGFTSFLTAEKATISSKASARLTPTKGAIAAIGYEYLTKMDAMLITARITFGNSGGPVINQYGKLVGVTSHIPDTDPENGYADDLGYGVAVPVDKLIDIIERKTETLNVKKDFFKDWDY